MTTIREGLPFRPGLYRHTKASVKPPTLASSSDGLYTALGLVRHHETGQALVLYYSHAHGTVNARPLYGYVGPRCADPDGFAERFALVTDAPDPTVHPSDMPADVSPVELWRSQTLLRNFNLVEAALQGIGGKDLPALER